MRGIILFLLILGAIVGGALLWLTRPQPITASELEGLVGDPVAGEIVFHAGGCASCHAAEDATGEDRLVLAGGQMFPSDFGTFTAPNISSDPTHGIGDWTLAQFVTAMQRGISPDGRHYYPAFPYTAYTLATRQDMVDLYAFMQTLPADQTPSRAHDVGFPFTLTRGIGAWNLLNMPDDFVLSGDLTEEETRGRYLAESLGHCGECHTARDAFGGLDRSAWLQGAPSFSSTNRVPSLVPGDLTWSEEEIAAYFLDGFTPTFDSAGGHMRSVILNLAQLPSADREALAAYLRRLP